MKRVNRLLKYSRPNRTGRRGALLVEALIASIAIGTASILAVTVLGSVNGNRRSAERQLLATQELHNQLERLTVVPWSELTPELVQQAKLSAPASVGLPHGELKIQLETVQAPRPGKRLAAELRWQDRGQAWRPPIRLTAWVFAPGEGN